MNRILGFSVEEKLPEESIVLARQELVCPVRSLVSVRFIRDGRTFTYYNDKFALEVGDYVYVSGKLAGQMGIVEKVTTKFKINLADYQRVISKASVSIHGTYDSVLDKMVSYDRDALSPDEFRQWILPPVHWDGDGSEGQEDEIIIGDGYELGLYEMESDSDVNPVVLERALDYCRSGKVSYISVRKGNGTAFVTGTKWYEVNFRLRGDSLTEMYCDCSYPGLCKHLLAVALTVRALVRNGDLDPDEDFVAIDKDCFWNMVSHTTKRVTL